MRNQRTGLAILVLVALTAGGCVGPPGPVGPAGPPGPPGEAIPMVKFLGLGDPTAGNAGIDDLNKACNDKFSGSRMCSSSEILNSAVIETFSSAPWIRPDIVGVDGNGIAVDASGLAFEPQKLSCDGWKNGASFFGLALIPSGGFNILACDQTRNVACCGIDN